MTPCALGVVGDTGAGVAIGRPASGGADNAGRGGFGQDSPVPNGSASGQGADDPRVSGSFPLRLGLPRGVSIRDDLGSRGSGRKRVERDGMAQFATVVQGLVSLLARLMIVLIFFSGTVFNKIPQFQATADAMAAQGVPNPRFALFGAIGLLLIGSLSVALGAWTRFGAIFLFVFLAAATYYFHDFWTFPDPGERQRQTIQFMKNIAIGGGLLSLMAFGGGPWSVDGWIDLKQAEAETAPPKPRVSAKPQQG